MTHLSELSSSLPETFGLKQKAFQADVGIFNASNNPLCEQLANEHLVFLSF